MNSAARKMIIASVIATGVMATLALTGCGVQGELEAAPPMVGKEAKSAYSESKSRETERAMPDANGKNRVMNPYTQAVPISAAPLEGFGSNPR